MTERWTVVDGRLTFSNGKEVGDVYQEVDGYWVVAFDHRGGCWSGSSLIEIGELLQEMNRPWDEELSRYFRYE